MTTKRKPIVHLVKSIKNYYALFSTSCGANYQTVNTTWDHKKVKVTCKRCLKSMKKRRGK